MMLDALVESVKGKVSVVGTLQLLALIVNSIPDLRP